MTVERDFLPIFIKIETETELNILENMCILFDKSMKDIKYTDDQLIAYKGIVGAIGQYFSGVKQVPIDKSVKK